MVNRRTFLRGAGAAGALSMAGVSGCIGQFGGDQPYGDGTVTFLMSPTEPQNFMMRQYAPVREQLDQAAGENVDVELQYARNYSAILSALGSGNQEVAETGPLAAALGVKADDAEIALQRKAFGTWDYTSVIVTRSDTDIEETSDLEGEKIAFADTTSASGSLYPLYMIQQAGLDIGEAPTSDNGADFTGTWSSHAQAITALEEGQVDAAGVGKFIAVAEAGTDQYKEGIRLVEKTTGIPRAPIIVSPELSDEQQSTIVDALANAPEGMYLGKDGEEDPEDVPDSEADDLWFSDVRPADLETYRPVVDVANELGLSTDLLDSAVRTTTSG
jgi:phosphonate transport system substrate-binding protein